MDNNMSNNEMDIKIVDADKPKSHKGILAVLISLVLILVLAISSLCYVLFIDDSITTIFMKPKEKVMYAFAKAKGPDSFFTLLSGNENKVKKAENSYKNNLSTMLHLIELRKNMKENGSETVINIGVDKLKIPGFSEARNFAGAGINTCYLFDPNNRMARFDLSVDYLSDTIIDGSLLVDDAEAMLRLDDIYEGYIMVNTETLSDDYYNSVFYDEMNKDIPEISFNIIDLINGVNDINYNYEAIYSKGGENYQLFKDLYDSIEVTETGEKKNFEIAGKETACKEYEVLIPADSIKDYVTGYSKLSFELIKDYYVQYLDFIEDNFDTDQLDIDIDELREELLEITDMEDLDDFYEEIEDLDLEDIVFNVYLDKKCRLIDISYENTIENEEGEEATISFDLTWHGKDNLYDDYDGFLTLESDDSNLSIIFAGVASYSDNERTEDITVEIDTNEGNIANVYITNINGEEGAFSSNIEFEAVEEEASVTLYLEGIFNESDQEISLQLDDITLSYNADKSSSFALSFNALFSMKVLTEEIDYLDGPEYSLFDMDMDELEDLIYEIEEGLENSSLGAFL